MALKMPFYQQKIKMVKKKFFVFLILLFISNSVFLQEQKNEYNEKFIQLLDFDGEEAKNKISQLINEVYPLTKEFDKSEEITNIPFSPGEELVFSVKYEFIKLATGIFRISKNEKINNRETILITSDAFTLPFYDSFYKVRDKIFSYVDAKSLISYKHIKIQREGNKKINEVVIYDYPNNKVKIFYTKYSDNESKHREEEVKIDKYVFDPFTALYYLRTKQLEVNKVITIPVSSSEDIYDLQVRVLKREKVKVPAGEFDCFMVRPVLLKEGIFLHKGDMDVWLTADEYKIPVKMKSKIVIGSIKADLKSYKLK